MAECYRLLCWHEIFITQDFKNGNSQVPWEDVLYALHLQSNNSNILKISCNNTHLYGLVTLCIKEHVKPQT